ncbi:MAG: ATP-binding protein [Hyphomicrobiales bacterium]
MHTRFKQQFKNKASSFAGLCLKRMKTFAISSTSLFSPLLFTQSASANELFQAVGADLRTTQVFSYAAFLATLAFAIVSTFVFLRSRNEAVKDRDAMAEELADLRANSERFESLIQADDQRLIVWATPKSNATVIGNLPEGSDAPEDVATFMAFGKWLAPASAAGLERHIEDLRENGTAFQLAVSTRSGNYLDAFGRTVGGRIFVRFRDLSGDQQVMMELRRQLKQSSANVENYQALLEEIEQPAWLMQNGEDGRVLHWANKAYRSAIETSGSEDEQAYLFESEARTAIAACHSEDALFKERVNAISKGARRTFDVVSVPTSNGSAGIATDVSEAQKAQAALSRTIESHEKTFDDLATAVVIFDKNHKLTFHNKAYSELFDLSESFLSSGPTDSEVIDKLRSLEKLPVEANFREWKSNLLKTHLSAEMKEFTWHLPDGQTLRVVSSPRSTGGVTWIYENLTAKLNLESRVIVLSRLQDETLNRLNDGVAVFSSDGRLTLSNRSFGDLWKMDDEMRGEMPHVNQIADFCVETQGCKDDWHQLKMAVVGVSENRDEASGTMERPDGSVIQYSTNALIDGRTMVTFIDTTDSVNFERALTEKNEWLKEADTLKNDFVQHVSYELRSPLTNIIGFTQLLADADIGPLTEKQKEYTDYILSSSSSLLAIINDILDLATADAGVLELDLGTISVRDAIENATEGLQDRLREREIELEMEVSKEIGEFVGDERRIIQILFNLISNAIKFSDDGGKVALNVRQTEENIVFEVQDWGAGIPDAFIDQIFSRFESRANGQVRGGAGLGLSIVKQLVELHQGEVNVDSTEGQGTIVTCTMPATPPVDADKAAAE